MAFSSIPNTAHITLPVDPSLAGSPARQEALKRFEGLPGTEPAPIPDPEDTFVSSDFQLTKRQRQQSLSLARQLTSAAGSADQGDVDLAVESLSNIPPDTLRFLKRKDVQILVGRDNVTDVAPELQGMTPRNWAPGSDFTKVSGVFDPRRNAVILSAQGHDSAEGPSIGSKSGSTFLTAHEVFHAVEHHKPKVFESASPFRVAYAHSHGDLSDYERHPGAGIQEAYAESAARYLSGQAQPARLDAYWDKNMAPKSRNPLQKAALVGLAVTQPSVLSNFLAGNKF